MFSSKKSDVFVFRKRFSTIWMMECIGSVEPGDRGHSPVCMYVGIRFYAAFRLPALRASADALELWGWSTGLWYRKRLSHDGICVFVYLTKLVPMHMDFWFFSNSKGNRKGGCVKMQILTRTRRCVRMAKMQGAEAEGAGSVLKYMTKPECR